MILTLYASIARLGPDLREASSDLGGNSLQTFLGVTLPLTVPGIAAGSVFVFVLSVGNFITPDLLGGGRSIMVGNLIYDQFLSARDWPFGSALAFLLIGVMMTLLSVQAWMVHHAGGGTRRWLAIRPEDRALALHAGLVYLFLYGPIAVLVVLSFNDSGLPTAWTGFSTRWYGALAANQAILSSVVNTLIVAVFSTVIATAIGTLLALGLEQGRRSAGLDAFVFVPMIIPDIVLAIALLSFYNLLNMTLGLHSIILSHVVFNIAFVCAVVRTRLKNFDYSIVEASIDLGASEAGTYWRIVLPVDLPGRPGRRPARLHPVGRRVHHRLLHRRRRPGVHHLPDASLFDDPLRRDAGGERHRHPGARRQLHPHPLVPAPGPRHRAMTAAQPLLEIAGVTKRFGPVTAVDEVSLALQENEFFALLGPSGCGKTTLLRLIAGFETPDAGRHPAGRGEPGRSPSQPPADQHDVPVLCPVSHLTVRNNIAYGLKMDGVPTPERQRKVDEALDLVQLADLAERKPDKLSGGQRQRVALARALIKRPRLLLLDEPLAALDRKLRQQMQFELKKLQHEVGITFIVVTHDQEEALAMADRIALLNQGRIAQLGSAEELYERPASHFVADFIGSMNFFDRPHRLRRRRGCRHRPVARASGNGRARGPGRFGGPAGENRPAPCAAEPGFAERGLRGGGRHHLFRPGSLRLRPGRRPRGAARGPHGQRRRPAGLGAAGRHCLVQLAGGGVSCTNSVKGRAKARERLGRSGEWRIRRPSRFFPRRPSGRR